MVVMKDKVGKMMKNIHCVQSHMSAKIHDNNTLWDGNQYLDNYFDFCGIWLTFSGSNTDGLFTTAVSNSFLSPLEKIP